MIAEIGRRVAGIRFGGLFGALLRLPEDKKTKGILSAKDALRCACGACCLSFLFNPAYRRISGVSSGLHSQ